ncbi:hypothetical protein ACQUSR_03950 [Streptomyces sp. P1-3]
MTGTTTQATAADGPVLPAGALVYVSLSWRKTFRDRADEGVGP